MSVAVTIVYVRGCEDCETIVSRIARSCIPDPSCSSFKAIQGSKHAHDVAEGATALPGLTTEPTTALPSQSYSDNLSDLPISDVNGYHPDLVAQHISDGLNGFDTKGR